MENFTPTAPMLTMQTSMENQQRQALFAEIKSSRLVRFEYLQKTAETRVIIIQQEDHKLPKEHFEKQKAVYGDRTDDVYRKIIELLDKSQKEQESYKTDVK